MSKIRKSWEDMARENPTHSPAGVKQLRRNLKIALRREYLTLAMAMFRWEGLDDERFTMMNLMSRDTLPEYYLMTKATLCCFQLTDGSLHMLPWVGENGINFYGHPNEWRVIPEGFDPMIGQGSRAQRELYDQVHNYSDSVIMTEDIPNAGAPDAYIDSIVDMLIDNAMTLNQLQLIAKMPILFNCTSNNLLNAKNYFLALSQDRPAIFQQKTDEATQPEVIQLNVNIDPALFELADRVECLLMEYLGIPCVPITKRAQQSVAEVESTGDQTALRRLARFTAREKAAKRINKMFGTNLRVVSVIDEVIENESSDSQDPEEDGESDPQGPDEGNGSED